MTGPIDGTRLAIPATASVVRRATPRRSAACRRGCVMGGCGMRRGVRGETSARAAHFVYDALADMHKTVRS